MTLVVRQNALGREAAPAIALDRRRRRLSGIVARHADRSRPHLVSVHRRGDPLRPTDDTVRMRAAWSGTLVGADDVVVITYLPRGGAAGGGGSKGKQIGSAVAMIALVVVASVVAGPAGTAISSAVGGAISAATASALFTTAVVAGGSYLLQAAAAAKANKRKPDDNRPVYGVSGGGNLPRPGDRVPRLYGRAWLQPDLSQADYTVADGEDLVLYKRMTVSLGSVRVMTIQVGGTTLWTAEDGVQEPFAGAEVEIIPPGGTSSLVPGSVTSSAAVASQELPRPEDFPSWSGPFRVGAGDAPVSRIQLDYSLPQGCHANYTNPKSGASAQLPIDYAVYFEYAPCDEDNLPTGPFVGLLYHSQNLNTKRAQRFTRFVDVPPGRYLVRARNAVQHYEGNVNTLLWDGLRAVYPETIVRPDHTEIALKVRSGKALGITAFADVWVEASARVPVWTGGSWTLQETAKAVWAYADILRASYGGNLPDGQIDAGRLLHYASTVQENDEFNGVIRGPVSVYEAAATVLGVMRAEPARIGNAWTMTRDEPRAARRHVFSRRQIVRDTSAANFQIGRSDGAADVVVEYHAQGDPRRRREWRQTFGAESLTPHRLFLAGVTKHAHAVHIATWMAAAAYYRRERRGLVVEHEGRLVHRNDPALVDSWFMSEGRAAGVLGRAGTVLELDTELALAPGSYACLRDRKNRQWGPVRVTAGASPDLLVLDPGDVATVEAFYGIPFASVFAREEDEPTVVIVGPLTEVTDPMIVQRVQPQGRDRVAIDAVQDHAGVWQALGEAIPPEPPVPDVDGLLAPTTPRVPWIRAQAVQKTTGLEMEWAVGNTRGAAQIVVDLSYDGFATSERVSEGLSTSGLHILRHAPDVQVRVRAYAVGFNGVIGPTVEASFLTFKPLITNDVAALLVQIQDLSTQLRHDIESIVRISDDTVRGELKKLRDVVDQLASDAATEAGNAYEKRELVKVAVDGAMAAVAREIELRAAGDEALAQVSEALAARLQQAETGLVGQAGAIEGLSTRVTANEGGLTAVSAKTTALEAAVYNPTTGISVTATAVQTLTARVSNVEGQASSQATSIQSLNTVVNGHSATLTTYGTSIDGLKVQFGVVGEIDGATGGFVVTGIRKADGSVQFGVAYSVQTFIITNGITSKVPFSIVGDRVLIPDLLVTSSAQIAELTVDTLNVKYNANTATFQGYAENAGFFGGTSWYTVNSLQIVTPPGAAALLNLTTNMSYVANGSTGNPEFRLIGSDGVVVLQGNNVFGFNTGSTVFMSRLIQSAPQSGTYFLQIRANSAGNMTVYHYYSYIDVIVYKR